MSPTPGIRATPLAGRLRAFASYSWATAADQESIGRIVDELRLRGFVTFRDRQALPPAGDIEGVIRSELARSAVYVPYLTPEALESDPVVDLEFHTAAELARVHGFPVVMPVVRNLGTDRQALTEDTWSRLQHDFSARWTRLPTGGPGPLEIADAAAHAGDALRAAFPEGEGPADGRWELALTTRGGRPAAGQLTIDGTDLLGGPQARVGWQADWRRVFDGLCDLKGALTAHGHRRQLLLRPTCHLSAALATGWIFRRTAGWTVAVACDEAECVGSGARQHPGLRVTREHGAFRARGGRLVVSVDLVPRGIQDAVRRAQPTAPRAYLAVTVEDVSRRIPADQLGAMAAAAAATIKSTRDELGVEEVALYLATPVGFAALVGAELGALGCPLQLHEHDGTAYHPSILIPE